MPLRSGRPGADFTEVLIPTVSSIEFEDFFGFTVYHGFEVGSCCMN